ncbi:MAG: hypothetical protein H7Y41_00470 [Hyphomonadaceae bacterium]|nr:hypothetical protein [Clostridia bacterium]
MFCPDHLKGRVMRKMVEAADGLPIETTEGVKIFKDGGWVMVMPHAQKPECRVVAEGYSQEFAQELTADFSQKIQAIQKHNVD